MLVPCRVRGQAHQDRVDIAAGLEPEQRAAIVDEVEFGVAPAPFELARLVRVGPRQPHAAAPDRGEDIEKGEPPGFGEGELCVDITFEMIVEAASNDRRTDMEKE